MTEMTTVYMSSPYMPLEQAYGSIDEDIWIHMGAIIGKDDPDYNDFKQCAEDEMIRKGILQKPIGE